MDGPASHLKLYDSKSGAKVSYGQSIPTSIWRAGTVASNVSHARARPTRVGAFEVYLVANLEGVPQVGARHVVRTPTPIPVPIAITAVFQPK